jgi:hypothetical protein
MRIACLVPLLLAFLKISDAACDPSVNMLEPQVRMAVVCNYTNFNTLITVSWAGKVHKSSESYSICLEVPKDDEPDKTLLIRRFEIDFTDSQIVFPPREWTQRSQDQVSIVMYRGRTVIAALDGVVLADICLKLNLGADEDEEYNEEDSFKKVKYFTY